MYRKKSWELGEKYYPNSMVNCTSIRKNKPFVPLLFPKYFVFTTIYVSSKILQNAIIRSKDYKFLKHLIKDYICI